MALPGRALIVVAFAAIAFLARAGAAPADGAAAAPALWHVQSPRGELYLFGSVHLLPPDIAWQSGRVETAIERANVFVFEIPADAMSLLPLQKLVMEKGMLAKCDSLNAMLTPEEQTELDGDCKLAGVDPAMIDRMRPWLAQLTLLYAELMKANAQFQSGVDEVLQTRSQKEHKELRFLETIDEQTALIIPADPKIELSEFATELKIFRNESREYSLILDAWRSGDVDQLQKITDDEFRDEPEAKKALIDDRNEIWLPKIEKMLGESRVFFVTVGEGHLIGPKGLPALLHADGYTVTGP
jgi:uncharacterized protein YbaP (TraB family)